MHVHEILGGVDKMHVCAWNFRWGKQDMCVHGILGGANNMHVCVWNLRWGKQDACMYMESS